jgi:hypothetical protein
MFIWVLQAAWWQEQGSRGQKQTYRRTKKTVDGKVSLKSHYRGAMPTVTE